MRFADLPLDIPIIDRCCMPDIIDKTIILAYLQEQIRNRKQKVILILMASLESLFLSERDKTLHITHIAFSTLFPTGTILFNSSKEIIVKLY